MGVALAVERAVQIQNGRVDPGAFAPLCTLSAQFHDTRKGLINGHAKRILLDLSEQALGHVEITKRNDPSHIRVDQKQVRVISGIAHGENPPTIASKQIG
tara:strand:+ start:6521 stop:6820 length:300 start_codon:yes stop_codon:yes gene_type:complete